MSESIDFMCIGAPRAGTSWLWTVLKQHPGIWMPPIKELHYFDRSLKYPPPNMLAENRFLDRILRRGKHNRSFRKLFLRTLRANILEPKKWGELGWNLRYLLGTCSDRWYLSLFDNGKEAVKGEITPNYAVLSSEDIQHIHALLPDLKVIYLLRNPVERTWSHLRFRWTHGNLDLDNPEAVTLAVEGSHHAHTCDYTAIIQRWSACFPAGQFLIGFYDDIAAQPGQLIAQILTFLNLDLTVPLPVEQLSARINASREKQMPRAVERFLAQKYLPEVQKLVPLVGGHSGKWLDDIEMRLKRD